MGLGQVVDLLHGLARAEPEQPAGADRDLALHGLEADRARVVPGRQERGQPGAPVGLDEREERDRDGARRGDEPELAQRQPGRDEQRGQREGDDERRAEVGLGGDQHHRGNGRAGGSAARCRAGCRRSRGRAESTAAACRTSASFMISAGWNCSGPAPSQRRAPLTSHAEAGQQHEQQQHEGDQQQQRRRAPDLLEPVAREQVHHAQAHARRTSGT